MDGWPFKEWFTTQSHHECKIIQSNNQSTTSLFVLFLRKPFPVKLELPATLDSLKSFSKFVHSMFSFLPQLFCDIDTESLVLNIIRVSGKSVGCARRVSVLCNPGVCTFQKRIPNGLHLYLADNSKLSLKIQNW